MFLYSKWMEIGLGTKHKMADIFGFKKVRPTHVSNNAVVDDGYNIKDIEEALTIHRLQDWLNSPETDLARLLQLTVDTLEGKMPIVPIPESIIAVPVEPVVINSKKNAKTKKKK